MTDKTILVVDDHEDTRVILVTLLAHFGYRTLEAADGLQAVSLARSADPDLVLMDYMMPEMDGLEACRRIRSDRKRGGIPVLMITGNVDPLERHPEHSELFDSVLYKPVSPMAVLKEVRHSLGEDDEG